MATTTKKQHYVWRKYLAPWTKLESDSEGFKDKLRKKSTWLTNSFKFRFGLPIELFMFLVTDIPMPILGADDEEITLTDFQHLEHIFNTVEEALPEFSDQFFKQIDPSNRDFIE